MCSNGTPSVCSREIEFLAQENEKIHHELSVSFGPSQLNKDVQSTKTLKELLAVREDYDKLAEVEVLSCKDLDVKVREITIQASKENFSYLESSSPLVFSTCW